MELTTNQKQDATTKLFDVVDNALHLRVNTEIRVARLENFVVNNELFAAPFVVIHKDVAVTFTDTLRKALVHAMELQREIMTNNTK